MPLPNPFKLEKLKIRAFSDPERNTSAGEVEAMFNPPSYSQEYAISYGCAQAVNSSGTQARFTLSRPESMDLELLLDGTGVDAIGLLAPTLKTVPERVQEFLEKTYFPNDSSHEPNYLIVEWGSQLSFHCRLKSVKVSYTSFDRSGDPLRAKLAVTLVADTAAQDDASRTFTSPDVTHTRVVIAGDTLPLLAHEIYGSVDHYLFVARANDLDDFRELVPGTQLQFPPLDQR